MKLIIEQLKYGFLFIDEEGERYAVSEGNLSVKVKAYFGVTKHERKNHEAPPAKVSEATKPETQGNKTADSHSAGATLQSSSTEHTQKQPAGGHIPKVEKTKLGTPDIIHLSDLKISKFYYDKTKMQPYENISFQEFPDGTVVLRYLNMNYYTTKENVMKIPYPFPAKYFSKENGWSSIIKLAFRQYRKYLAEQENKDDWKYKPLLKKDTKGNHGEDYEKIEGSLEV